MQSPCSKPELRKILSEIRHEKILNIANNLHASMLLRVHITFEFNQFFFKVKNLTTLDYAKTVLKA
jgi:hypothetical protein